jgi:hypothetical protein
VTSAAAADCFASCQKRKGLVLIASLQEATCEWQGGTGNCKILPPTATIDQENKTH